MSDTHGNRFEQAARTMKAAELYLTARARQVAAADVANNEWTRRMLIANTPLVTTASDETWRLVFGMVSHAEKLDRTRGVDDMLAVA